MSEPTCIITDVRQFNSATGHGWIPQAIQALKDHHPICIAISGEELGKLLGVMRENAGKVSDLISKLPIPSSLAAMAAQAVGIGAGAAGIAGSLAGLGAVGGMGGAMAALAALARTRDYRIAFVEVLPQDLFDAAHAEVHLELVPPRKPPPT